MLFNSYEFLFLFLPAVFFGYFVFCRFQLFETAKLWLIAVSLFFYAWWNIWDLPVILVSMAVNFAVGRCLSAPELGEGRKHWIFLGGVAFNLLLLGYYKYADFLIQNVNAWTGTRWPVLGHSLPLGISFFTFTQIAYLADIRRGAARGSGWANYFLFVTFFPHLLAGPIIHHQAVMPQFDRLQNFLIRYENLFKGLVYILVGMLQKVLIADYVGPIAQNGFVNASLLSAVEAWAVLLAYTLQIYFDFAGYSNMAIGLARLFNIEFPVNFNSPYQAVSIVDFWRRWHMTLSQFLRDYLYIPLGGNRGGEVRRYFNVFITMFLGGLWHGAGWTFIVWGCYHGLLITLNQGLDRLRWNLPRWIAVPSTLILVSLGWVFFRASDMDQAGAMFRGLFGLHGIRFHDLPFIWFHDLAVVAGLTFFAMVFPNFEFWIRKIKPNAFWLIFLLLLFTANILFLNRESAFLYFQF